MKFWRINKNSISRKKKLDKKVNGDKVHEAVASLGQISAVIAATQSLTEENGGSHDKKGIKSESEDSNRSKRKLDPELLQFRI